MKIRIIVDENDADYRELTSDIDEVILNMFKPLIEKIKNFELYSTMVPAYGKNMKWDHAHNFPYDPYNENSPRRDLGEKDVMELYGITEEFLEHFLEYVPRGDCGLHTIVSIEIFEEVNNVKLL